MKKVAIICNKGFGSDGISAFIMNNYRCFDHKLFRCTLIYPAFFGDIGVINEKISDFSNNGDSSLYLPKSQGVVKYFFLLVRHLKKQKYDVVHIHGSSASIVLEVLAAKIAGVKNVCTHSHNTTGNHIFVHKICRILLNLTVTNCLACGRKAGLWMYGNRRTFQIVPNGIELSKYKFMENIRVSVRKKLNVPENQMLIGHVGGTNAQKNQKFLVEFASLAQKRNLSIRMIFIGPGYGSYLKEIQDNVKSLNLTDCVSFLGQRTDVNELMMGMDAFFLPSLFEGFPIVSIEAQASGLPVFMSDTISKEVEITDLVHWLSIDKGPECWLLELEKCSFSRNRSLYADEVKKRGFDVQTSSVLLQKIYLGVTDEIDR